MKKLCSLLLSISLVLSTTAFACAETFSFSELKEQVPQSVSFTINGTVYEVPVMLPTAEEMPVLFAAVQPHTTDQDFVASLDPNTMELSDTAKSIQFYGLKDGHSRSYPSGSVGYRIMEDGLAENNELSPERPAKKMQELLEIAGLPVDLRPVAQVALSRLYRSKWVDAPDRDHRYWGHEEADESKPMKGYEQGLYRTIFAQYIQQTRILNEFYQPEMEDDSFQMAMLYSPLLELRMLSETEYTAQLDMPLRTDGTLCEKPTFAPFEQVVEGIQARIDAGTLQSVYSIELCYQVLIIPMDEESENTIPLSIMTLKNENTSYDLRKFHARLTLVPVWRALGYDTKDCKMLVESYGFEPNSAEMCELGGYFDLRFSALTGKYLTSAFANDALHAEMLIDFEEAAQ